MKRIFATAAALSLPLLAAGTAGAQTTMEDLSREIEALKQGQAQIQKQLAEMSAKLQAPPARAAAPAATAVAGKTFELAGNPVKGDPAARLTLIEFLDYQ